LLGITFVAENAGIEISIAINIKTKNLEIFFISSLL